MKITFFSLVLMLVFAGQTVHAQLIVDDFKTGGFVAEHSTTGYKDIVKQGASILGKFRFVRLQINDNVFKQKMQVSVQPETGALVASIGYKLPQKVELKYGVDAKGANVPLNLNVSKFSKLNIEFEGLRPTNFNVVVFSTVDRSQYSENLEESVDSRVVSIPLTDFVANKTGPGFSLSDIDYIVFVMQPIGYLLCNDFAIKKIWFE